MSSCHLTCFSLLLLTRLCCEVTGDQPTSKSGFLWKGWKPIGAQRYSTISKKGLLDRQSLPRGKEVLANIVPYEAVENTDVPERKILSDEMINKYYKPKRKKQNKKRFTIFRRFGKKSRRSKRQVDPSATSQDISRDIQYRRGLIDPPNGGNVIKAPNEASPSRTNNIPEIVKLYKEAQENFTMVKLQLYHQFGQSMFDDVPHGLSSRGDVGAGMFPWDVIRQRRSTFLERDEYPILRSASPSTGLPWPMPQVFRTHVDHVFQIDRTHFVFALHNNSADCDVIQHGTRRYLRRIFQRDSENMPNSSFMGDIPFYVRSREQGRLLQKLEIKIEDPCSQYPSLESNETYALHVNGTLAVLEAPEVWGALRGLQTFSQLLYHSPQREMLINKTDIYDFPRYKHRGILLDSSRHFLTLPILKKNLDAMEMNKMNVFHWHIVDDQSFPYVSHVYPDLSAKGAYSQEDTYNQEEIADLIGYARLRGIRVIPEFDTPGHTRSWGVGYPDLLTECGRHPGPIDPSKNSTYEFMRALFSEIMDVFPDKHLHLGGDECSFQCWRRNSNIRQFMRDKGFENNYAELEHYYINRLAENLRNLNKSKEFVFWQEIIDNNIVIPANSIVEIWKGWGSLDIRALDRVTQMGLRAIYSAKWYLNYISYGKDWTKYYTVDPRQFVRSERAKQLIIGGEACMWGEFIDSTNVLQTLWPRAAAVAERLWSPKHIRNPTRAEARFEENRCRMIRWGIPASPNSGPGSCNGHLPF